MLLYAINIGKDNDMKDAKRWATIALAGMLLVFSVCGAQTGTGSISQENGAQSQTVADEGSGAALDAKETASEGVEHKGTDTAKADGENKTGADTASSDGENKTVVEADAADGEDKTGADIAKADGENKTGPEESAVQIREDNKPGIQLDSTEESADKPEETSYTEKEVPVFRNELTDKKVTLRFYDKTPNVAYIGIKEYYDLYMENSLDQEKPVMTVNKKSDNCYALVSGYGEAEMDTDRDILASEDLGGFLNLMSVKQEGIDDVYCDGLGYIRIEQVKKEGSGDASLDFGKYGIDIIGDEGDVYFPVMTISDIFTDAAYNFATYNGEYFYIQGDNQIVDMNEADPDFEKPIMENLKDGLYRPDDVSEYTYKEICFSFDHFYGFPGRAIINDDLKEMGLENALKKYGDAGEKTIEFVRSNNMAEFIFGCEKLGQFTGDGGHTDFRNIFLLKADTDQISEELKRLHADNELNKLYSQSNYEYNQRFSKVQLIYYYYYGISELQKEAYGEEKYHKEGDTAVFVLNDFMGFDMPAWKAFYEGEGEKPDAANDDIVAIVNALEDAEKDPAIKNFVFDCSINGGGSCDEAAMLYSIITGNKEVENTYENTLTGQKITIVYEADRNLDGKFDSEDNSKQYDLNFAVVTSGCSFSACNIFAGLMKESGYMIMGEQSGGGSCSVLLQTTGDGFSYCISSYKGRYIDKNGKNIDSGIPVDCDLIPKRSDGKDEVITLYQLDINKDGKKEDVRVTDYSELYNIERLSEEMNKFYK